MVASRPEVEWDETEQAWMRALEHYRTEMICPSCGWPKEICQDPMTEFKVEVPPPTRCHVTTALRNAQKAASEKSNAGAEGLLWAARLRADGAR